MIDRVPPLEAKQPGLAVRAAAAVFDSVQAVTDQIEPYTEWWNTQNQSALGADGPLLIAIGDSTAIGIGASHPGNGYVGRLVAALDDPVPVDGDESNPKPDADQVGANGSGRRHDRPPWRVINLAQSGAKFDDGLERQLPIAEQLSEPALVICCLGTNDLMWGFNTGDMRAKARALVSGIGRLAAPDHPLPTGIVCSAAGRSGRARLVNRAMRAAADAAGLAWVNPWNEPGPGPSQRLAPDRFHPNDLGYTLMARPLGRRLGLEAGQTSWSQAEIGLSA